jgi:phosphate-selective porin OprO/OprP
MKVHKLAVLLLFCILLMPVKSQAQEDLLEILRDNGTISREQYETLKLEKTGPARERVAEGLRQKSRDFKFRIGGRLQLDAAVYDEDNRDLGSGTKVRRARLYFAGKVYEDWRFKTQFDFADNAISIKNAYIAYTGFESTVFRVGNFKEPFSIEDLTSSKYDPFMEDSLSGTFIPGRNIGAAVYTHGDIWTASGGIFGEGPGDSRSDGEGYGATGRITLSPVHEKTRAVHLGIAAAFRAPADDTQSVSFGSKPESAVTPVRLVTTGDIGQTRSYVNSVLEGAMVRGPFSLQGEYFHSTVRRSGNSPNVEFQGSYILASWFITGESRNYNYRNGNFSRIHLKNNAGKGGAWELGVRYSQIDLNDGVIAGGEEENITLGLNWYVNPLIRFMANVVWIDTDPVAGDENITAFQMRAQIEF